MTLLASTKRLEKLLASCEPRKPKYLRNPQGSFQNSRIYVSTRTLWIWRPGLDQTSFGAVEQLGIHPAEAAESCKVVPAKLREPGLDLGSGVLRGSKCPKIMV